MGPSELSRLAMVLSLLPGDGLQPLSSLPGSPGSPAAVGSWGLQPVALSIHWLSFTGAGGVDTFVKATGAQARFPTFMQIYHMGLSAWVSIL